MLQAVGYISTSDVHLGPPHPSDAPSVHSLAAMPSTHPLRRISTGSLSSLARSQDRTHSSPSGLDFLQPALTELADEAATLGANIANLNELHDALGTFNEAFAGWLYALKMNAFCVEWPVVGFDSGIARGRAREAQR